MNAMAKTPKDIHRFYSGWTDLGRVDHFGILLVGLVVACLAMWVLLRGNDKDPAE